MGLERLLNLKMFFFLLLPIWRAKCLEIVSFRSRRYNKFFSKGSKLHVAVRTQSLAIQPRDSYLIRNLRSIMECLALQMTAHSHLTWWDAMRDTYIFQMICTLLRSFNSLCILLEDFINRFACHYPKLRLQWLPDFCCTHWYGALKHHRKFLNLSQIFRLWPIFLIFFHSLALLMALLLK